MAGFRPARGNGSMWRLGILLALTASAAAGAAEPITVERLVGDGWEIAGYTGTFDNRSSLMLFRHKDRTFFVQCSVLYDVTRNQRVNLNCYEIH